MRDSEVRQIETLERMRGFGSENASDFPVTSLGGQKFAALDALVTEIDQLGAQQSEGQGAARSSTQAKGMARIAVRSAMRAISDTAEALESAHPGISETFRLPRNNGDEALINAARAFVTSATPLKNEFIQREMPATFIEDLTAAIEEFEEASGSRNLNTSRRVTATAALRDALERGMQVRRELDPIVRNKYRSNPSKLAAWESASRIERAPRKKSTVSQTPQP